MKKKKIIFISSLDNQGGTEHSLVNMLRLMPLEKYDITIGLFSKPIKEIQELLPSCVKIRIIHTKRLRDLCLNYLLHGRFVALYHNFIRRYPSQLQLCTYWTEIIDIFDEIEEEFDVVIAYWIPVSYHNVYAIMKVRAKRKVLWIHLDPLSQRLQLHNFAGIFNKYDTIVNVSKSCQESFQTVFPELADKCRIIHNFIDIDDIIQKSLFPIEDFRLGVEWLFVSVARIAPEKQHNFAIEVTEMLLKKGINSFKWLIIGDGPLKEQMINEIERRHLSSHLQFLGSKSNPYPYIKNADIFICTSQIETYCLSVAEAILLKTFVICTDFPAAHELITSEQVGTIVSNNYISVYEKISEILENGIKHKNINKQNNLFNADMDALQVILDT